MMDDTASLPSVNLPATDPVESDESQPVVAPSVQQVNPVAQTDVAPKAIAPTLSDAPLPSASAPAYDFNSINDKIVQDKITAAQAINGAVQDADADKMAKAKSLGDQFGLPAAAIADNLPAYEALAQVSKNNQILQQNPALADFMRNSDHAAIAKDDFDKLNIAQQAAVSLAQSVVLPIAQNALGRSGSRLAIERGLGQDTTQTEADIQKLKDQISEEQIYQPTGAFGKVAWGISNAQSLMDNVLHALPLTAAGGATGAALGVAATVPLGGVGAIPGAIVGASSSFMPFLALDFGRVAAGQTYLQLNDARDKNGAPMGEQQKQIGAAIVGVLTTGIGMIGGPAQGSVATNALHAITGDAIKEAMTRPAVMTAVKTITKNTAVGAGQGAAMMGSMALAQQVGMEMGKQISPGDWDTVANDPKLRAQYVSQLGDAMENGAILFGALHGAGGAIEEYGNFKQSEVAQQQFGQLMDASAESKTRERSPDVFQTFMQSQLGDTGAENVYVPVAKVREIYDKGNVAPSADDGLFGKAVPDIAEQMQQAAQVGGDVVIPAANYATHIAGTPIDAALRPDIRVTSDGMSMNEAKEFQRQYQDVLAKISEAAKTQQDRGEPANKIFNDVHQKIKDAGFTDHQAKQYAAVIAAQHIVRADRLAKDPWELYSEHETHYRRGETGEKPEIAIPHYLKSLSKQEASTAAQAKEIVPPADENMSTLTVQIKQPTAEVKQVAPESENNAGSPVEKSQKHLTNDTVAPSQKGKPTSLYSFIRNNGKIKPNERDAGDLAGGGHKDLLSSSGKPADTMREMAEQHGYVPQGMSVAEFHDLLNDTNGGREHFRPQDADRVLDALEKEIAQHANDPDYIQHLKETSSAEEYERIQTEIAEYHAGLMEDVERQEREFLESRGDSWEDNKIQSRDLEDIEHEIEQENAAAKLQQSEADDGTAGLSSGAESEGTEGKGQRGVSSESGGQSVIPGAGRISDRQLAERKMQEAKRSGAAQKPADEGLFDVGGRNQRDLFQSVFHGSPYHFDKFTLDHIGSGEGAQAYGWGLYFAGKEGVADFYRNTLARKKLIEKVRNAYDESHDVTEAQEALLSSPELTPEEKSLIDALKKDDWLGFDYPHQAIAAAFNEPENYDLSPAVKEALKKIGKLYEVDIPEDGDLLHWDKKVSEQSPAVREALKNAGITNDNWTGAAAYSKISDDLSTSREVLGNKVKIRNDEGASRLLNSMGVKGIKYLDAGSRTANSLGRSHNYVIFDDKSINILRTLNQDARAYVTYAEGKRIVTLLGGADKTSILHEMGHMWLTDLQRDAARADAPEQLKKDWVTVSKFIGHEGEGEISTPAHETFAEAAEQYFMEGKAPSFALRSAFRNFKQWFSKIYGAAKEWGVPINDDIRGVFDRVLATDDEISQMEARQQANQLFRTKEEAGMTDAEFKAYNETALNAQEKAREQLLSEAMQDVQKRNSAAARRAEDAMRPEVEKEISNRQDMRTLEWFKNGILRDGKGGEAEFPAMSISRSELEAMSPGAAKEMPRSLKVRKDGASPDEIAPLLGYESGKEMIDDLRQIAATEKVAGRKSVAGYLSDQEINARLKDKFEMSDNEMRARAEELVGNPDRIDLKLAELRALGRKTGEHVMFTKENIGAWADNHLEQMRVKDAANTYQFVRAAAKAGRDAAHELAKGDDKAAMEALQRQAINMTLADRARRIESDYTGGNKLFKYAGENPTIKSIDQSYLDQVHGVLSKLGLKVKRDATELSDALKDNPLNAFVEAKTRDGYDIAATDDVVNGKLPAFTNLTVTQFNDLHDAIQSLMTNGRNEKTITVGNDKLNRDEVVAEIIANLQKFKQRSGSEWVNPKDAPAVQRGLDTFTSLLRGGKASLAKMERLFTWMDQNNALGPLNRTVFRPLKDGFLKAFDLQRDIEARLEALKMPDNWDKSLKDTVENDSLIDPDTGKPVKMTRKTMLAMALNTGNRGPGSNFEKLVGGYGWSGADVDAFLQKNMTKPDWDIVQHIWYSHQSMWPEIQAMERRLSGVAPPSVKAAPFDTPFGRYEGGYYPITYDKNSMRSVQRANEESLFDKDYFRPSTPKGHTIARVQNYSDKIALDLDLVPLKIKQAAHDLGMREAIINANKILSDPRVLAAVDQTWGREYSKLFRPWLKDIANGPNSDDRPLNFFDKTMRYSRMAVTQVGVGFRISTPFLHGTSAAINSVDEIGAKPFAEGLQEYYSDRAGKLQWVMDTSNEIRTRMNNYDRDARLALVQKLGEDTMLNNFRRYSTFAIAHLDRESAVPTWIGAYRDALRNGNADDDAIYIADQAVRNAHGAQTPVDTAAIQRGSEGFKMFTLFYGFFDNTLNRVANLAVQGKQAMAEGNYYDTAKILAHTVAYTSLLAAVHGTFRGNLWSGTDSWEKRIAKTEGEFWMSMLPIARDAASFLEYGHGSGTPLERMMESIVGTGRDVSNAVTGQKVEDKWMRHALETVGYISDLPTGQIGVSSQYLWDVWNGKENPKDTQEWLHGLIYGKSKSAK